MENFKTENIEKELQGLVGNDCEDLFLELSMITAPLLEEDDTAYLNFKDSERVIEVDENGNRQVKVLERYCFETELSDLCIEIRTVTFLDESDDSVMEEVYSVYMC